MDPQAQLIFDLYELTENALGSLREAQLNYADRTGKDLSGAENRLSLAADSIGVARRWFAEAAQ